MEKEGAGVHLTLQHLLSDLSLLVAVLAFLNPGQTVFTSDAISPRLTVLVIGFDALEIDALLVEEAFAEVFALDHRSRLHAQLANIQVLQLSLHLLLD